MRKLAIGVVWGATGKKYGKLTSRNMARGNDFAGFRKYAFM